MKRLLWMISLLVCTSVIATAQTYYTQSKPASCFLSDGYVCNGIPLGIGSSYNMLASHFTYLSVGDTVSFDLAGVGYSGSITNIAQQAPPYQPGVTGQFAFTFSVKSIDGTSVITGAVHGTATVERVGRWRIALIENSVVAVN